MFHRRQRTFHNSSVVSKHSSRADVPKALLPHKKKMPENNRDESYGWYKAEHFSDYMERVVGEITIKFISILIIFNTTLR